MNRSTRMWMRMTSLLVVCGSLVGAQPIRLSPDPEASSTESVGSDIGSVIETGIDKQLNTNLDAIVGSAKQVMFSPGMSMDSTGERLVYVSNHRDYEVNELFVVPVAGGESVPLSPPLESHDDVDAGTIQILPDDSGAVYLVKRGEQSRSELYVSRFAGGDPVALSPVFGDGGTIAEDPVVVSKDSKTVIYRAAESGGEKAGLFAADLGSGEVRRLTSPGAPFGSVGSFAQFAGGAGDQVIFLAAGSSEKALELYKVPLAGGEPVKLSGNLPEGASVLVSSVRVSPDGESLVYVADAGTVGKNELHVVKLDGSAPRRISVDLPAEGDVVAASLMFDAKGARVLHLADASVDNRYDVYIADLNQGTSSLLLSPPSGFQVAMGSLRLSPDERWLMYRLRDIEASMPSGASGKGKDKERKSAALRPVEHLHVLNLSDKTDRRLNPDLCEEGTVLGGAFTADSASVVFTGPIRRDDHHDLFMVDLAGGEAVLLSKETTEVMFDVLSARIAPKGDRVIFLARPVDNKIDEEDESKSEEEKEQEREARKVSQVDKVDLFSVLLSGEGFGRINPDLADEGRVYTALFTPDGSKVVYTARQEVRRRVEIFAAPVEPTQ